MTNMLKLMRQAATLRKDMEQTKEALARRTVEFSSGGGMVAVKARGDLSVESIRIDPKAVDPGDVGRLEGLVLAAVDGALNKAKQMAESEMSKLASGLGLPGLGM